LTYDRHEVHGFFLRDDLVSEPFVLGMAIEQIPIDTQIPVADVDGRNDRHYKTQPHQHLHPFVVGIRLSQTQRHNRRRVLPSIP
jgi:hypothetical protein